jgi:sugar PTS system EIIA component
MLKKFFREKKESEETLVAPITGNTVAIEGIPDEMFSQKMLGDGMAIEPTEGVVVSPLDGEVIQFFPTKHAVGIRGINGLEVLIHIGLETVALNGEGFEGHVQQGDQVKAGDKLVTFDLEFIKEKADSIISPVVITNLDIVDTLTKTSDPTVHRGESVLLTAKFK